MISCPEDSNNLFNDGQRENETSASLRKLYLAIGICTLFMVIELVGGYFANSLAIISDAVHLLSDVAGFLTSVVAIFVSRRSASKIFTFGFQRAQTLGALASIAIVWLITTYLVLEAIKRIKSPENINGKLMFFIALFGMLVNIVLALTLGHNDQKNHTEHTHHQILHETEETSSLQSSNFNDIDINLRAAFIHVIGDLVQSVGVLIASAFIWYNEDWRIADPICTLFFSVIVVISTIFISKDILRILMEGSPKEINVTQVNEDLEKIEGVIRAHDLHVWAISSKNIALTVHVTINPHSGIDDQERILAKIQEMLCVKYKIHHSTIQIELNESMHCNPIFCVKN